MEARGALSPFRDLLRRHRVAAGLSQERLAERSGLSVRAISDLERGLRRAPRLETVRMLADALGLGLDDRHALFQSASRAPRTSTGQDVTLPAPPAGGGLPIPPTPLVGREQELAMIRRLLSGDLTRLVTLTGLGGVGKTRLAIEAGRSNASLFPDGVLFIDLSPVVHASLVETVVAEALDVAAVAGMEPSAALARAIGEKKLLLILDNFEHVVAAATFVARLLGACANLRVLVTSRVPLGLRGERQLTLSPLALPRSGDSLSAREVAGSDAVRLFMERARDVSAGFALSDGNACAIAGICRHLDGIPLALELAAARVKVLTPLALLERLERRLPLLVGGAQDLPERHQTLRATIAWSHDLLGEDERALFRRLAIFAGGWTLDAAERVANPGGDIDVFEALASLVNHNLVRRSEGQGADPRYIMLETIREFALEQFRESGEEDVIGHRHARYFFTLARLGSADLADTPGSDWLARLESEQANMRAALGWLRDHDMHAAGLRFAAALGPFWRLRNAVSEGLAWLETFLGHPSDGTVPDTEALAALQWAGELAALQGDYAIAEQRLGESLDLARKLQDDRGVGAAVAALASLRVQIGDIAESLPFFEEALAISERMGNRRQAAFMMSYLAFTLAHQGHLPRARALLAESQDYLRALGDVRSFEAVFNTMAEGWFAYLAGDHEEAARWFEAGLLLGQDIDAKGILTTILAGMGESAMARGRCLEAFDLYLEGLRVGWDAGFLPGVVFNLQGLARTAVQRGDEETAAKLIGATMAFGRTIDALPGPGRAAYEETVAHVRSALGERFAAERAHGAAMRPDEVIELARGIA